MKKIVRVLLNRGPINECGKKVFEGDGIEEAVLSAFRSWGYSSPKKSDGGYDKLDFTVTWEGGEEYSGRFDMQFGGTDGGESFWASLRRRLDFGSCRCRPPHFKDDHWAHYVKTSEENGRKAACEAILDGCEVPA